MKKQRHHFADKGLSSQNYGFSSSHVWMWEWDHKEGWASKNWCFQIVVWRRLLRILWTAGWSNQSILKETNPEYSLEALMVMLKLTTLWPHDVKSRLIGKDSDAGKDWRQKEGVTKDEMVGWHYWLNEHEFEPTLADTERQGSLACCNPWSRKESDMT